jgi:hypothetical protein
MRNRLVLLFVLATFVGGLDSSPAAASTPTVDVIPIDFSFNPPVLSAVCGFTVTRHVVGTLTIRTFSDNDGAFTRELDQYHLVETLSANGQTLVGRTTQNIQVVLLDDGSYTVAFAGPDFRVSVPGGGISFGSVGRLVLLFDADNNLLSVELDAGNVQDDFVGLCQALEG